MAFYTLEPFGYNAQFQGHALVASLIAETNRNSKKRSKPYTYEDFMPKEQVEEESVFNKLKRKLFPQLTKEEDGNSSDTSS